MIFGNSPELWVFLRCPRNMKYEHAVSLRHYSPILLCSLARRTRPHPVPYRFPLWRCACSPANRSHPGMLLPLP